ncbi:3214_t:CDS:2 [Ambispora gerdemannii]|uniref:3214_t:CDS:1 n=1 Tax=Ambispora gerdemannii TaxID=144530 RepID=A0A9N9G934_9GLOM|nr:3214_t:CDS:2 [Ambispora gerdemannii]
MVTATTLLVPNQNNLNLKGRRSNKSLKSVRSSRSNQSKRSNSFDENQPNLEIESNKSSTSTTTENEVIVCSLSDSLDVIIEVGEGSNVKKFKTNSEALIRCPYFNAGLSTRWAEKENGHYMFKKPNITPQIFEVILSILQLLLAAEEFMLDELCELIHENAYNCKNFWYQEDSATLLKTIFECESFIKLRGPMTDWINENPNWLFNSPNFGSLKLSILRSIISNNSVNDSCKWDILIQWSVSQIVSLESKDSTKWSVVVFEVLKESLANHLSLIRFSSLSRNDYYNKILPLREVLPDIMDSTLQYYLKEDKKQSHHTHSDSATSMTSSTASSIRTRIILEDSNIINHAQALKICKWLNGSNSILKKNDINYSNFISRFTKRYEFKLLYRGSRDGFSSGTYHSLCDNKGKVIVLAKVARSPMVIGGYYPMDAAAQLNYVDYVSSKKSFIFSFSRNNSDEATPSRIGRLSYSPTICSSAAGPGFGHEELVFDLDSSPRSKICYTKSRYYSRQIAELGEYEIEDVEVFQLIKL